MSILIAWPFTIYKFQKLINNSRGKDERNHYRVGGFQGRNYTLSHPPNLSKWYSCRAKTKKRSGKTTENLVESYG